MIDLSKIHDYFQPEKDESPVHIVGCGSVGSTVAENLVRCGVRKITLWDFDTVEAHNIVNQMYRHKDIGQPKVEALKDILTEIDPDVAEFVKLKPKGWNGENMSGYIFLCVDDIELRRKIVEQHMSSQYVKAVFDFRTRLEDAQHYAADWSDPDSRQSLLNSMMFSNEEADEATEVSACGVTLGVCTTVRIICAIGVANYINFIRGRVLVETGGELKKWLKQLVLISIADLTAESF